MWRILSYSFLVLLSASFLAFSLPLLFSSQTAHAVSTYDDIPWTTDTFSFQGDDLTYTSKAFWMGSCGNATVKENFLAGRYIMVKEASGAVQLLTWPTSLTSPGNIGFGGGSSSGYVANVSRIQGSVSVNAVGSCNLSTTFNSSMTLVNSNTPQSASKVFIAGPEATIHYPAGYEGPEPLRDFPIPPSPQPSGDAITKAEMEEISHESLEYQRRLAVTIFGLAVSVLLAYAISMKISRFGR